LYENRPAAADAIPSKRCGRQAGDTADGSEMPEQGMNAAEGKPWPAGGGQTGELLRNKAWDATPLGPIDTWPRSLRTAVEIVLNSPVAIVMLWGPDGVMIYNDAYSIFAGGRHPRLFGSKVLEGWPEVADFNRRVMEVGLRGETLSFVDQPLVLYRNGQPEEVWLNLDYSPLFDDDGKPAGVFAVVAETTLRVLAERQAADLLASAQSSAATLQQWFDQAPGFVALLRGPTHIFEMVNRAYYRLVGHREMVGKTVFDALPEVRDQGFESLLTTVFTTGKPFVGHAMSLQVQRQPGDPLTQAYVDFVYQPVFDAEGRVSGIFAQGHEVTEQMRASEALRNSEERFRLAVESSSLGTFDCNLTDGTLVLSPQAQELFSLSGERLALDVCLERVHPGDRPAVEAAIEGARDPQGDGRYFVRHRILRPDGGLRWVNVAGRVGVHERSASGAPRAERLAGVLWDITEQQQLVEALQQADRRKDEFLAILAHELRNPLAPIRQAAQLAKSAHATDSQRRWGQDIIERQVEHMALLLDDLLDVSRISRGRLELRREPVDLRDVVEAAVETARPSIEAKQHTLDLDVPKLPALIHADPLRLAQVLSNLLTNAAKYTDRQGTIRVSCSMTEDEVTLQVNDNGIGLSQESLPHIFEMFSQVDAVLDRAEGGLGIGLALSRGLAELHGGVIEAASDGPGRGSCFTVRLPRGMSALRQGDGPADGIAANGDVPTGKRVLIADDNVDAADSLRLLLELSGHEVHVAYDGEQAVRLADEVRPHAAILDIGMPKLNGYEAAQRIRTMDGGLDMKLIALTGWGKSDDVERAIASGFDHHCTKPADVDKLQALF
jgi:PAS domain S-box-containing protein